MKTALAVVGVDGTGKTTLVNKLEKYLSNRSATLSELTRSDVFKFCNLPIIDLVKASHKQLLDYDIGSLELQMQREEQFIRSSKKEFIIIDKGTPFYLMQLTTLSGRFVPSDEVKNIVRLVNDHVRTYYSHVIYLPMNSFFNPKGNGLERNYTNGYLASVQDIALEHVIKWLEVKYYKLSGKVSARAEFVMDLLNVGVTK